MHILDLFHLAAFEGRSGEGDTGIVSGTLILSSELDCFCLCLILCEGCGKSLSCLQLPVKSRWMGTRSWPIGDKKGEPPILSFPSWNPVRENDDGHVCSDGCMSGTLLSGYPCPHPTSCLVSYGENRESCAVTCWGLGPGNNCEAGKAYLSSYFSIPSQPLRFSKPYKSEASSFIF